MDLTELDLNGSEKEIKTFFISALWEAIESAANQCKNLPEEIDSELCNKAAFSWQREIQDHFDTMVENAVYDFRYHRQAKHLLNCVDNENELVHCLWNQDYFTFESSEGECEPLLKFRMENYLEKAGGTEEQIKKILSVVDREAVV